MPFRGSGRWLLGAPEDPQAYCPRWEERGSIVLFSSVFLRQRELPVASSASILIFLKRFLSGEAIPKTGLGLKLIVPFSGFFSPILLLIGQEALMSSSKMHCGSQACSLYALPSAHSRNA